MASDPLPPLVCSWRIVPTSSTTHRPIINPAENCLEDVLEALLASRLAASPPPPPLPLVVDEQGSSLLHKLAVSGGMWDRGVDAARRAIAALTALGCGVNARDLSGSTPLIRFAHRAAEKLPAAGAAPLLVPLLRAWVDAGAEVDARDAAGHTAWGYLQQARASSLGEAQAAASSAR